MRGSSMPGKLLVLPAGVLAVVLVAAVTLALTRPGVPSHAHCSCVSTIRWFVGLDQGTTPDQVAAEERFVYDYNAAPGHPVIKLEIVPNGVALDRLETEMASGNSPDIVGPFSAGDLSHIEDLFLDLGPEATKAKTDLADFDSSVLDLATSADGKLSALPYSISPGVLAYNKKLFDQAGLPYPPHTVGQQYLGKEWSWDTVAAIAAKLTRDANGKTLGQTGFNALDVVQYGLDFGYADARRMASTFAAGSVVDSEHLTATIPAAWSHAWHWYQDAMWKSGFAPSERNAQTQVLGVSVPLFYTGHVGMQTMWPWELSAMTPIASREGMDWDVAVMPSYQGKTTSPVDVETFGIPKTSKHPAEAYAAMTQIMSDPGLRAAYGLDLPAQTSQRQAAIASLRASLSLPAGGIDWSVMNEMATQPAIPSPDSALPDQSRSLASLASFYEKLRTDSKLDVDAALTALVDGFNADWWIPSATN